MSKFREKEGNLREPDEVDIGDFAVDLDVCSDSESEVDVDSEEEGDEDALGAIVASSTAKSSSSKSNEEGRRLISKSSVRGRRDMEEDEDAELDWRETASPPPSPQKGKSADSAQKKRKKLTGPTIEVISKATKTLHKRRPVVQDDEEDAESAG